MPVEQTQQSPSRSSSPTQKEDLHRSGHQEVYRPGPIGLVQDHPACWPLLLGGRAGQVEQRLFRYALEERQPRESRQVHGVLAYNGVPIDGLADRIGRDVGSVARPKVP